MDKLLQAFVAFFEEWLEISDTGTGHLEEMVADLKGLAVGQEIEPRMTAVIEQWLPPALAEESAPHCEPIMAELGQVYQALSWVSERGDDVASFASTEVVRGERVAGGFSLLAPEAFYLPRQQGAAEFFGILSGLGEWQIYYNPPVYHPPGAHIFHPPLAPHAMRAGDEPLLLIWAWFGDLSEAERIPSQGWL